MSKTFVITDIHGCCRSFDSLLGQIGFARGDTLYLLGDYIDRGPDSRGVLEKIIALSKSGHTVQAVLGNHEDMLLKCIDSGDDEDLWQWFDNGGSATLKSYDIRHPRDIDPLHISFLRGLPVYIKTGTHVFVHAGLNFCLRDPLSPKGRESMLWQRSATVDSRKIAGRVVVSGHTILTLDEIMESIDTKHVRLDNGCFTAGRYPGMGSLVALELETGELFSQEYIG